MSESLSYEFVGPCFRQNVNLNDSLNDAEALPGASASLKSRGKARVYDLFCSFFDFATADRELKKNSMTTNGEREA